MMAAKVVTEICWAALRGIFIFAYWRGGKSTMRSNVDYERQVLCAPLLALAATIFMMLAISGGARAGSIEIGDAVVTGFSGVTAADDASGGDPLDEAFIDLDGASMQIQRPEPDGPPDGQVINAPATFKAKASEVGQVFAIAFDDGDETAGEAAVPNVYLGATSVYGIQIVLPDSDGDGRPERVKNGHPNAEWMPGQFGPGGGPGSIWKVDGKTGEISQFATIPGNTGAGIGDIVYDRATRQFFVSDLDTGFIHRLSSDGTPIDVFDHGETARASAGLSQVPNDGHGMDIKDPAFDALNSDTWGLAQPKRMIWGLGLHGGRLYYAVADGPEIWSVGINLDGSFAEDARREIEVIGTPGDYPISDIAFDNQGAMFVAQRGGIKGSWDYNTFTGPKKSVVFRFKQELPDDPATPGTWVPIPDEYAIGFPPEHRNTSGGIALGYTFDELGQVYPGTCGQTLWTTGDNLRDNPEFAEVLAAGGPASVHGLQGNDRTLVRPDNVPPAVAYFIDYDGAVEDPEKSGHVGDVEVLQPCASEGPETDLVYDVPQWTGDTPPPRTPSESFNLTLSKIAQPEECWAGGIGWQCGYTVRVTNTGTTPYFGDITLTDWLPDPPLGTVMQFSPQPPWNCTKILSSEYECTHLATLLNPGESVDLFVTVESPADDPRCYVDNAARLEWAAGYTDNDASDNVAFASAVIPSAPCAAPAPANEKSNLEVKKSTFGSHCAIVGTSYYCTFLIEVANTGPGVYGGQIDISETLSAPATTAGFSPSWNCSGSGANYTCSLPAATLNPGQSVFLAASFEMPQAIGQCELGNLAEITNAPGGSDANSDPSDDSANASIVIPSSACIGTNTNLQLEKFADPGSCFVSGQAWTCGFTIKLTNRGPGLHDGPININDGWTDIPAGWSQHLPFSWACNTLAPPNFECTTPAVQLAPGQSIQESVWITIPASSGTCQQKNSAAIVEPAPGTPHNSDSSDDKDSATAAFAQLITPTGDRLCGFAALEERIGPLPSGAKPKDKDDEKSEKDDDKDDFVCPTGWTKTPQPGKCCPHGTSWDGERCKRGGTPPDESATIECWSGWEKIAAKETKSFIRKGYKVRPRREGNETIWCARKETAPPSTPTPTPTPPPPPPPTLDCWSGWEKIGPSETKSYTKKGYTVQPRREGNQAIWCARKEKPQCKQVWKDVCTTKPERECRKVTDNVCEMVPKQDCRNVPKQVCNMQPRQDCRNVTKQVCNMQPKRECRTVTKNECRTVPQKFCGTGEFSGCVTQNRQVCGPVNKQVCTNTMQRVCHPENQRVCNKSMLRVCHQENQRTCTTKMQRVCSPKTRTDCKTVQKRSCTRQPETVCN